MDDAFRAEATDLLIAEGLSPFNPIAARDFRGREIDNENEIVDGDLMDVLRCSCVFGNYTIPGWGTGMETWFAYSVGRPIVAYVAPEARVSPWVARVAGGYSKVVRSVSEGVSAVGEVLS